MSGSNGGLRWLWGPGGSGIVTTLTIDFGVCNGIGVVGVTKVLYDNIGTGK